MKRLIVFTVSFILLFSLWQIGSGLFLTLFYTPNIESAWESSANLSSDTLLTGNGVSIISSLLIVLISAIIARRIPKKENMLAE